MPEDKCPSFPWIDTTLHRSSTRKPDSRPAPLVKIWDARRNRCVVGRSDLSWTKSRRFAAKLIYLVHRLLNNKYMECEFNTAADTRPGYQILCSILRRMVDWRSRRRTRIELYLGSVTGRARTSGNSPVNCAILTGSKASLQVVHCREYGILIQNNYHSGVSGVTWYMDCDRHVTTMLPVSQTG